MKTIIELIKQYKENEDTDFLLNYSKPFDFYEKNYKSDVKFIINDDKYELHSDFIRNADFLYERYLMHQGNYFKNTNVLTIPSYNKTLFELIIKYLYDGDKYIFKNISESDKLNIFVMADYIGIKDMDNILNIKEIFTLKNPEISIIETKLLFTENNLNLSIHYNYNSCYIYKYDNEKNYMKNDRKFLIKLMDIITTNLQMISIKNEIIEQKTKTINENFEYIINADIKIDREKIIEKSQEIIDIFNYCKKICKSLDLQKNILDIDNIYIFEPLIEKLYGNKLAVYKFVKINDLEKLKEHLKDDIVKYSILCNKLINKDLLKN